MQNLIDWLLKYHKSVYTAWMRDTDPDALSSLAAYVEKNYPNVWEEYINANR